MIWILKLDLFHLLESKPEITSLAKHLPLLMVQNQLDRISFPLIDGWGQNYL